MRKLAVYPGAFDPMTNGHIDIARRALNLFDTVIIAVATNSKKQSLFSIEERIDLIHHVITDLGIDESRLEVTTFNGLTVDFCEERGASAIIRGLRAVTDFDYEYAISLMNKKLAPELETVFFMASGDNSFVSSSIVKEVARHGRSVAGHVHEIINEALLKKFKELK
ncbi:MAG TPA: pantetheine-phosphate adenylyltransferase [Leptospiraceae bacterium]|nr:pantetheine-phosphate adenylyltransferase [Leptospiraceae bacterium]HMW06120.1 pantetheine-phosphate adenylyltransferase [Leptospiraceae bacterium]HMX30752.1 pantetheine-phosphate adenylyltransferase [Leptospiraceae bacterium]HMY31781.1 pantetheine-phosphate adenylyltransferase [Leptospiraceae bacterium]HMZ63112.1 pantetheine-phosphate adenylyltransferase [Leptospiraceae bacterium]